MSRSGTSLLTSLLAELQLFTGKDKTRNQESAFFQTVNKWFLSQSGGGLEYPGSIQFLLKDGEARKLYTNFIRFAMRTPRVISFLGWKKYIHYRTPLRLDIPWGWKDPRNTYTLPLWLDIFQDAKIIHIYRHGIDVVHSLRIRRENGLSRLKNGNAKIKPLYWFYLMQKALKNESIFAELRCATFEEGLTLWEEYMNEARKHVSNLRERALEIRYEELLSEPPILLRQAADFCELDVTQREIELVSKNLNRDRAYAYLKDPELKAIASNFSERLKLNGY